MAYNGLCLITSIPAVKLVFCCSKCERNLSVFVGIFLWFILDTIQGIVYIGLYILS